MNEIKIFENPNFGEMRTAGTPDNPLFCLKDVSSLLGLSSNKNVKNRLNEKGVITINPLTPGGVQQMVFIDEPNLYRCIFQSRKPEAEKFQEWVTSEVLPTIRRTGGYLVSKADESPEDIMARALIVANETISRRNRELEAAAQRIQMLDGEKQLLESENKALAPKAEYTDRVLQSLNTYTMTQVAKELGMSAVSLEKKLHEKGVIFKQPKRPVDALLQVHRQRLCQDAHTSFHP